MASAIASPTAAVGACAIHMRQISSSARRPSFLIVRCAGAGRGCADRAQARFGLTIDTKPFPANAIAAMRRVRRVCIGCAFLDEGPLAGVAGLAARCSPRSWAEKLRPNVSPISPVDPDIGHDDAANSNGGGWRKCMAALGLRRGQPSGHSATSSLTIARDTAIASAGRFPVFYL